MILARWTRRVWWLAPLVCLLLLGLPSATLPGNAAGLRRFETPPLGPELRLAQTFTMTTDGLRAIEVFPVRIGERPAGDVRFELYEIRPGLVLPVRAAEVLVEDVLRASSYRFEFAPIGRSEERTYRLDLVAAPATGVAFWATRGGRYAGGSLYANGRERWADLAFRVDAPMTSIWDRLVALHDTNPGRVYVVIAALSTMWVLLGVLLRALAGVPPASGASASADPA